MTTKKSLVILDELTIFDNYEFLSKDSTIVIAVDFRTHKKLEEKKISHELLDNYLQNEERQKLYDFILSKYNWFDNLSQKRNYEFKNINILSLMSPLEFHEFLLSILIKFLSIKNVLEKNHSDEIFVSKKISEYIKLIQTTTKINILSSNSNNEKGFLTDKIEIRFNIFSKPFTFYLSKKTYSFLKSKYENFICKLNNLWLNEKSTNEIILLVEFNSGLYHELISNLSKSKRQLVLLNRRRPAVLSKNSIDILKSNNVKILNYEKFSNSKSKEFTSQKNRLTENIDKLWQSEELFSLFSINGITFWPLVKDRLKKIYDYRLDDYLKFIFQSQKFLKNLNIKKIIHLGESGETENILLQNIDNDIESILLQHSFLRYHPDLKNLQWRYEDQNMIDLKSKKFFVWGNNDLNYFSEQSSIKKEQIFVSGSPRHDKFFKSKNSIISKNILITLSPISERSGLGDVNLVLRYNQFLTNIIQKLKKINNSKIIIKLHPGENPHNSILLEHLSKIPDIVVYQTKNSKDLIVDCEFLINVSPELYDSSTIMLEALILQKPVVQLILDDESLNISPLHLPIIQIHELKDFDEIIQKLQNEEFKKSFIEKIPIELNNYLSHQNSSSARILELIDDDS